jgi:hypothetical protein
MKILVLHDNVNEKDLVILDAEDFSMAFPTPSGSAVTMKSAGASNAKYVHETPSEVLKLLKEALEQ